MKRPPSEPNSKPANTPPEAGQRSGRVGHDARGNPVWEWQTSTGIFERTVTPERLRKLEAHELSLMDTQSVRKLGQKSASTTAQTSADKSETNKSSANKSLSFNDTQSIPVRGMNPYDSDPTKRRTTSRPPPGMPGAHLPVKEVRQSLATKYRKTAPNDKNAKAAPTSWLARIKSMLGMKR